MRIDHLSSADLKCEQHFKEEHMQFHHCDGATLVICKHAAIKLNDLYREKPSLWDVLSKVTIYRNRNKRQVALTKLTDEIWNKHFISNCLENGKYKKCTHISSTTVNNPISNGNRKKPGLKLTI